MPSTSAVTSRGTCRLTRDLLLVGDFVEAGRLQPGGVRGALKQPVAGFHAGPGGMPDGDSDPNPGPGRVVEHLDRHRCVVAQAQTSGAGVRGDLFCDLVHDVVELWGVQDFGDAVVVDGDAVDGGHDGISPPRG